MRIALIAAVVLLSACDQAMPDEPTLVLEAYFQPGHALPAIRVAETASLGMEGGAPPVQGADVAVELNGTRFAYHEEGDDYRPASGTQVEPGQLFSVAVSHRGRTARASGVIPPAIDIDSVRIEAPDRPIEAVLLDSLTLGLDSLSFEIPSRTGFIYPVRVQVWWQATTDAGFWVEASARPLQAFSSRLIDFFLQPSTVLEERAGAAMTWSGLYAVPVASETAPMPEHAARIALVRGTVDYARYALSRSDPDRREPRTNVTGGVGMVTGIALDSVRVYIE